MSRTSLHPLYFGTSEQRLFGCFHEPEATRMRDCGVLICQPMGHEYVNSHRALRQLAVRLNQTGFPVFRFDFFGCGDSYGNVEEGSITRWLDDISQAISETKLRSTSSKLCLIGLRLGASLATTAASVRNDVASLVLWDPVINGRKYLRNLVSFQKEMSRFRPKPPQSHPTEWPIDIMGFPVTKALYEEIASIDLLAISKRPAQNVVVVRTTDEQAQNDLASNLQRLRASVTFEQIDAPHIWLPTLDGSLLVPGQVLQAISSWMSRVHP
jgi:pimeloyl-ACP methyl ester carboxylesterase